MSRRVSSLQPGEVEMVAGATLTSPHSAEEGLIKKRDARGLASTEFFFSPASAEFFFSIYVS